MINSMYQQPANPLRELNRFFHQKSALSVLIIINISIWILIQILKVLFFLFNQPESSAAVQIVLYYFALPAYLPGLMTKPWSLMTYMFLHVDFWHIIFNMLWLYWFGKIFLEYLNGQKLWIVYLLGGLSGGLFYILAFNIFPVFSTMIPQSFALGASASVMAVVTAISFYVPQYSIQLLFIGRIRIIYLAIILFIFDFFMIPTGNSGGHLAHIGGALFGFVYSQMITGRTTSSIGNLFRKYRNKDRYYTGFSSRPMSDEAYNSRKVEQQKRIDEILEKISKGGYDSLSKEEKEFLFKTSTKK